MKTSEENVITDIVFLVVVAIAVSALVSKAGGSSESATVSVGSLSDRINAARLMEAAFNQSMGCLHKVELMGPESTILNLLCSDPAEIANAYDFAPPTSIRKLKLAGFTTIIFSDQNGQPFRVVDLTT